MPISGAEMHAFYVDQAARISGEMILMPESVAFSVVGVPFIMAFFFLFVWNLAPIIEWCINKLVDFLVNL